MSLGRKLTLTCNRRTDAADRPVFLPFGLRPMPCAARSAPAFNVLPPFRRPEQICRVSTDHFHASARCWSNTNIGPHPLKALTPREFPLLPPLSPSLVAPTFSSPARSPAEPFPGAFSFDSSRGRPPLAGPRHATYTGPDLTYNIQYRRRTANESARSVGGNKFVANKAATGPWLFTGGTRLSENRNCTSASVHTYV